jgi:tetrahydromethanopterin S-methyltransferase subunit F
MEFNLSDYTKEFSCQWMAAEETIKLAERVRNEAVFPSIQELRYAGRRMVQIFEIISKNKDLSDNDVKECHRHAIESIENCYKAKHDAIDAAIMYAHSEVDTLVERAGAAVILQTFSEFQEIKEEIDKVDKIIISSRADRNGIDKKYEEIKNNHLGKIQNTLNKLLSTKEVLEAVEKIENETIEIQRRQSFSTGIVTGLIAGIITGIISSILVGILFIKYDNYIRNAVVGAEIKNKITNVRVVE